MSFRYAYAVPNLPWTPTGEDERRFERVLWSILLPLLIVAILIPFLPLLVEEVLKPEEPPRPVTLVLTPPPPPPRPKVEGGGAEQKPSPVQPVPKPEPERAAQRAPTPRPQPAPQTVEQARERAAHSGILSASRELQALQTNPVITSIQGDHNLMAAPTTGVKSSGERVFAGAGSGSGGISTTGIGHTGGGGTSLGEGGTGGALNGGGGGSGHGSGGGGTGRAGTYQPKRNPENIQIVFDRNKAGFDSLYARALRQNANLRGKIVLELTILPSGKVSGCRMISSDLHDPDLEAKIVSRVLLLDFGAEEVPTFRGNFPMQFFQS